MKYEWYKVINNSEEITQGDIIRNCPVLKIDTTIPDNIHEIKAEVGFIDAVVMTQACDLQNDKVEYVILCSLTEHSESGFRPEDLEGIRQGRQPAYHMINEYDSKDFNMGFQIVDFRNIYSLPIKQLKAIAIEQEIRLRILPPYREHLAQAFARFFMRIGLPSDIPSFKKKKGT
jgi:hypothetical protein